MKKNFNSLRKSVWVLSAVLVLSSCNQEWNDHYSYKTGNNGSAKNIVETIEDIEGSENFIKALQTTYLVNSKGNRYESYYELFSEDQFLTVWLPSDGSITPEEWAYYTKKGKTPEENADVAKKFIMNHVARFKHPVGADTEGKVYMLSDKSYKMNAEGISGVPFKETNIRCTNGILHKLNGTIKFLPNIYDFLVSDPKYGPMLGKWLDQYTIEEIDNERSVASGINDEGEMMYIDSVMIKSSILLSKYGFINEEDSDYALVIPNPTVFAEQYERIKKFYEYAPAEKSRDSLQEFWTKSAMLTDMVFNMNKHVNRHPNDSVISTLFSKSERMTYTQPYHVFYNPYDETNGLFKSDIEDSIVCSNGIIYVKKSWPFADTLTFLRPIKVEAENVRLSGFVLNPRTVYSVFGKRYQNLHVMEISKEGIHNWQAKYYIDNTLKAKYQVKYVVVPNSEKRKPNMLFHQVLFRRAMDFERLIYPLDEDGYEDFYWPYWEDLYDIDTINVGEPTLFPYCNYKSNEDRVQFQLSSEMGNEDLQDFTSVVWLDCIILEPVVE